MPLLFGTPPDIARGHGRSKRDITQTREGHLNTGMHGNYFLTKYLINERHDL